MGSHMAPRDEAAMILPRHRWTTLLPGLSSRSIIVIPNVVGLATSATNRPRRWTDCATAGWIPLACLGPRHESLEDEQASVLAVAKALRLPDCTRREWVRYLRLLLLRVNVDCTGRKAGLGPRQIHGYMYLTCIYNPSRSRALPSTAGPHDRSGRGVGWPHGERSHLRPDLRDDMERLGPMSTDIPRVRSSRRRGWRWHRRM